MRRENWPKPDKRFWRRSPKQSRHCHSRASPRADLTKPPARTVDPPGCECGVLVQVAERNFSASLGGSPDREAARDTSPRTSDLLAATTNEWNTPAWLPPKEYVSTQTATCCYLRNRSRIRSGAGARGPSRWAVIPGTEKSTTRPSPASPAKCRKQGASSTLDHRASARDGRTCVLGGEKLSFMSGPTTLVSNCSRGAFEDVDVGSSVTGRHDPGHTRRSICHRSIVIARHYASAGWGYPSRKEASGVDGVTHCIRSTVGHDR